MPTPILPDVSLLAPVEEVRQAAVLQTAFGSQTGFGKWTRYEMRNLLVRMSDTRDSITISGDGGQIAFCQLGETTIVQLDTRAFLTIAGTANSAAIIFRLPEGWAFRPRQALGAGTLTNRHVAPLSVYNNAVLSQGFVEMGGRYGVNTMSIFKDLVGTAWANGDTLFIGQCIFENAPDNTQ